MEINVDTDVDYDCTPYAAELFMMQSAYPDSCIQVPVTSSIYGISFEVKLEKLATIVRFNIPIDFPDKSVTFSISGKFNNSIRSLLMQHLLNYVQEIPDAGCMLLCEVLNDELTNIIEGNKVMEQTKNSHPHSANTRNRDIGALTMDSSHKKLSIARFLIYFHHIMSGNKRRTMIECARHYDLGGFSKHGYPGICIVEGELSNVLGFVRDIQQLRWKQMVVRGEEIEELSETVSTIPRTSFVESSPTAALINASRKLPYAYFELDSMSDAGALCKRSGLHDLFMTSMKKYET